MRPVAASLAAAAVLVALLAAVGTLWASQRHEVYVSPPAEAVATVEVYCSGLAQQIGDAYILLPYDWYARLKVTAVSHGPGYEIDMAATPGGSRSPVYLWVPPRSSTSGTLPSPFTLPTGLYARAMPGDVYRVDVGLRKVDEGLVALWYGAPQGANETSPVAFPEMYTETGPVYRNETDLYIPAGVTAYWGSELVGAGRFVVAEYTPYEWAKDTDIPAFIQMVAGGLAGVYHFGNGTVLVAGPDVNYTLPLGNGLTMVALDASDGTVRAYVNGSVFILGNLTSTPTVYAGVAGTAVRPAYLAIVIDRSLSMDKVFQGIADGIRQMMAELARYNVHYALVEYVGDAVPCINRPCIEDVFGAALRGLVPPPGFTTIPVVLNDYVRIWTDFTNNYEAVATVLKGLSYNLGWDLEPQIAAVYAAVKYLSWPADNNTVKVIALIGNEGLQNVAAAWPPDAPDWVREIPSCTVPLVTTGICPRDPRVIDAAEWVREQAHAKGIKIFVIGDEDYYEYMGDVYVGPLTSHNAYQMGEYLVRLSLDLAKSPLGARYRFFAVFKSRYLTIEGLWPGDRVYVAGGDRLVSLTATGPVLRVDLLEHWTLDELVKIVEAGGFRVWVVPSPQHLVALLPRELFLHARGDGVDAWLESLVGFRVYCTPRVEMLGNSTIVKLWVRDGMVALNVSTDGGRTWAFIGAAPYAVVTVRSGGRIEVAGYNITAGGPWRGVWVETVNATLAGTGEGAVDAGPVTLPVRWREALVTGPATVELRYG